ncbi:MULTISPECIES: hypothetical protein [unclassified Mesorhizobium]|uniref:hypothetical protein n=1 Tax=unclassified Mesorhizobium TaxID=325217 RepID=UPI0012DD42ED|nr:hypothetical protein [Mesorhizobium sp. L2C085B000]
MDSNAIITSLPVAGADRFVLIEAADAAFEAVIERIEPNNEEQTRSLWDAGDYIDNSLFTDLKLPMHGTRLHIISMYSWYIMSLVWRLRQTERPPNRSLERGKAVISSDLVSCGRVSLLHRS